MKIINTLTVKNLKLNKSRTIVTMIGILLSCALITVVANVAFSLQKTMLQQTILTSGNYIYSSNYASTDTIKRIQANRNVEEVYVEKPIGYGQLEEPKNRDHDGIAVAALNEAAFENGFSIEVAEGRLPQNGHELVLANNVMKRSKKTYKVGDSITLQLGERVVKNEDGEYAIDLHEGMSKDEYQMKNNKEYTYQIVGILKENHSPVIEAASYCGFSNAFTLYEGEAISEKDSRASYLYANFKQSELKNYKETIAEILGMPLEIVQNYMLGNGDMESETYEKYEREYHKYVNEHQIININNQLISRQGIDLSKTDDRAITILAAVVIAIILIVSVFVIRNSFAISITEKTKLYGMISSVGATARQIRNNVLFEGLLLGVISIPLGIALGFAVTGGLIAILNFLLEDFLSGLVIQFGTSIWTIVIAVGVSSFTIFLSSIFTAIRASKIPPIVAIRNNLEVKVARGNKIKSSRLVTKLYGIGGQIAYRSLKRSKKKYRTTVISIVMSVMLFISLAAFMKYSFGFLLKDRDNNQEQYNIMVYRESSASIKKIQKEYEEYKKLGAASKSCIQYFGDITLKESDKWTKIDFDDAEYVNIQALSTEDYRKIAEAAGLAYEDVKGKAIYYYTSDTEKSYEFPENAEIKCEELDNFKIAKSIDKVPENISLAYGKSESLLIESSMVEDSNTFFAEMYFNVENADQFEENINNLLEDGDVTNYDKEMRLIRAVRYVVAIFVYGFIIVVTLIGITNIFNTITTNMKLRQKEFAMLRSVGMTDQEFRRMIRLESFLYGTKALLIGLPLGLLGNYLIYYGFSYANPSIELEYQFPYVEVIGCVLCVFILIRCIMAFSVSKTKKQNIIETIRNDNI